MQNLCAPNINAKAFFWGGAMKKEDADMFHTLAYVAPDTIRPSFITDTLVLRILVQFEKETCGTYTYT